MKKLLDINEVAALFGISVNTIYNRKAGTRTLRRVKLGKKLMFRIEDVEQWVKCRIEEPAILRQRVRVVPSLRSHRYK